MANSPRNQSNDGYQKLEDFIKKIWAPIAGLLGAATTIIEFIKLWQGDQGLVSFTAICVGILLLLSGLGFVAFSKYESPIQAGRKIPFFPRFYKVARRGLLITIVVIISGGIYLYDLRRENEQKLIILVSEIPGPEPENYQVTNQLIADLRQSTKEYSDIVIIGVDQPIVEANGKLEAQKLAKQYQADIVIWGWYAVTKSNVWATLHLENFSKSNYVAFSTGEYFQQAPISAIQENVIQQDISKSTSAFAFYLEGIAQLGLGKYREAITLFDRSLELSANDETGILKGIYLYRGNCYLLMGEFAKSIYDYDSALSIDPGFPEAYYNRGNANRKLRKYSEALSDYQIAINYQPLNVDYLWSAGIVFYSLHDYDKALEYFDRVIALDDDYINAYISKAAVYKETEELESFIDVCELGIKNFGYEEEGIFYYYLSYSESSEQKRIEYLTKAIDRLPKFDGAYLLRAQNYEFMGEYDKAISDYNTLLERSENLDSKVSALFGRASTYSIYLDNYDLAIADYDNIIAISDKQHYISDAYSLKGRIFRDALQDYQSAIICFTKAIEIDPSDFGSRYERGLTYVQSGNKKEAIKDFRYILENFRDNPEIRKMIEDQLQRLGEVP